MPTAFTAIIIAFGVLILAIAVGLALMAGERKAKQQFAERQAKDTEENRKEYEKIAHERPSDIDAVINEL